MCLCAPPHVALESRRGLELQAVMSFHVGVTQPGSTGAVRAFNPRAISAIPVIAFAVRQNELVLHVVRGARTTGATISK